MISYSYHIQKVNQYPARTIESIKGEFRGVKVVREVHFTNKFGVDYHGVAFGYQQSEEDEKYPKGKAISGLMEQCHAIATSDW
jgi:hypothetical protein